MGEVTKSTFRYVSFCVCESVQQVNGLPDSTFQRAAVKESWIVLEIHAGRRRSVVMAIGPWPEWGEGWWDVGDHGTIGCMGTIMETIVGIVIVLVGVLFWPAVIIAVLVARSNRREAEERRGKDAAGKAAGWAKYSSGTGRSSSMPRYPDAEGRMYAGDHATAEKAFGMSVPPY